jgi:serine/threonine protein kinase
MTHSAGPDERTLPMEDEATRVAPQRDDGLELGTVLRERFVLEDVIGYGGMSVVYRALDRRREEANDRQDHVAIKLLGGSFRDHPDAFVALQREARRAQTLAHPNIATVYDFDRHEDTPYLCMELLSGQTLDRLMQTRMPLERVQTIIRGIAEGLDYAHQRGIVHADLKPSNVFITDRGEVKLLDFGIARVISRPGSEETTFDAGQLGALTPPYASCEMFEGRAADPRDDVYALACVSYELLTGRHPFDRLPAPDAREAQLTPDPVPELSREQNHALLEGLAFDRVARTPSAGALYASLFSEPARTKGGSGRRLVIAFGIVIAAGAVGWLYLDPSFEDLRERLFALPTGTSEAPAAPTTPETDADQPLPIEGDENGNTTQPVAPLDDATRARIERILEIADLHRQMGKLIEPAGTNAAEAYAEVIRLQPDNASAMAGLAEVGSALAREARALDATGDHDAAVDLVERGLTFAPDHPELTALEARWAPSAH